MVRVAVVGAPAHPAPVLDPPLVYRCLFQSGRSIPLAPRRKVEIELFKFDPTHPQLYNRIPFELK